MSYFVLSFISLLSTALALVPAAAHLMEFANKITLAKNEYLIAQKLYRGWQFVGVVVIVALVSTFALTVHLYNQGKPFVAALVACICVVGTQGIFWIFTFPVNRATSNWSELPATWPQLRRRWEYSHAASAILNLVGFVAVILAVLWADNA